MNIKTKPLTKDLILHSTPSIVALYHNFILIFLITLIGLIITTFIISINTGFDFTDEGGFLLSYKNVNIYRGGVYNYHIIIAKLTNWLNPGIIEYRLMSFIITILSSFILAIGLYKWLNANYDKSNFYKKFIFILCFVAIGNFIFYSMGVRTISNYTLTNFLLQTATGLILYLFSYDPSKIIKSVTNLILLLIIGFICAFSFFIKFSTGILELSTYILIFVLYAKDQKLKHIFIVVFSLILGSVIGTLTYFTFFQGFYEWIFNFKKEYFMLSDHQPSLVIKTYIFDFFSLIIFSLKYFSWLIIFPLFILLNNYISSLKHNIYLHFIRIVLFASIVIIGYEIIYLNFYRTTLANDCINAFFYIVLISLQVLLLFAIYLKNKFYLTQFLKNNLNKMLIVSLLCITPFLGAVGTSSSIFLLTLIHAAPWFGVIVILLIYLEEHIKRPIILSLFIIIPGLVTTSQIIDGNIFTPYYDSAHCTISKCKNRSNFFQQTEQVDSIPRLNGIYIDSKTKKFLLEINQLLKENNYRKGYPIFGYYIPGVVYLLEGISPSVPYYLHFTPERNYRGLAYAKFQNTPPILMLTDRFPLDYRILYVMQTKGIHLSDYLMKGEVYYPVTESILKLYFPKSLLQ